MVRPIALPAAIIVALLAVSGAGGISAQTPKRGGTVIVLAAEPPCLNPLLERCVGPSDAGAGEVLEGAFEIGPHGTRPNLVSGVTYSERPPFYLIYHIRPEARWSDRIPITARDFVFTDTAIRKYVPPDSELADLRYHLRTVRSVRALNAKT
jgi:ABC-type transport system substrate-binding protein